MLAVLLIILTWIFSLFSYTLTNLDLVVLLVICYSVNLKSTSVYFFAFLAGIIFDLTKGQTVGITSLVYLIVAFLISLYRQRFRQTHILYLLPLTFFTLLIINFWQLRNPEILKSILLTALIIPLNFGIYLLKKKFTKSGETEVEI